MFAPTDDVIVDVPTLLFDVHLALDLALIPPPLSMEHARSVPKIGRLTSFYRREGRSLHGRRKKWTKFKLIYQIV